MYIKYMNIALDLSKGQLSKLRNGHGIRINPTMFGTGVEMIIDPMTYHNLSKKLDKGKGAVIKMGMDEIQENRIQGTGLFAGAGNKSGKISRIKKARKWRDFSDETLRKGIDTGRYGYEQIKEAKNPVGSKLKKMFGFGAEDESDESDEEVEGGKISFKNMKKAYNKKVKNTKLGKALRGTAENLIRDGYDRATDKVGKYKNFKPIAEHMGNTREGSVRKATQMTGLGRMKPAVMPKEWSSFPIKRQVPPLPKGPTIMPRGKGLKLSGEGMRLSGGGHCSGCGMYNDKFIFENQAL